MPTLSISVYAVDIARADLLTALGRFRNRSECIRSLLEKELQNHYTSSALEEKYPGKDMANLEAERKNEP